MKKFEEQLINKSGLFPNMVAVNSTGPATQDGSEYVAEIINNSNYGFIQALMFYPTSSGTNITALSGTPGVPNGRIEANGDSQLLESIQKGNGIGPGMLVQRAINDTPSVWGDRVIQLAGQGVLVATYPDLVNAVWIGGNTAAQQAAKDAGKDYWRASDAAGVTPNAAGAYLILPSINPSYFRQYLGALDSSADFIISGNPAVTILKRAIAIPYLTSDGGWRLRFNIDYNVLSGSRNDADIFISGAIFQNGYNQSVSGGSLPPHKTGGASTFGGLSKIRIRHEIGIANNYFTSGDVELFSKPTWADDFQDNWYITY